MQSISKSIIAASFLAFSLISCGGGDDLIFFDKDTEVVDINTDDINLSVGEGTVVGVEFSFDEGDVFGDDDNVSVLIRLPQQLRFRPGTSEIQELGEDDEVGAQLINCPGGVQYLLFDLDDNDLSGAENPSGEGDAELTFTVDAVAPATSGAVIEASASKIFDGSALFACPETFDSEESEVIVVN